MFSHDTLVFPSGVEVPQPLSSPLQLTPSERQQFVRLAQAHGTSQALARRVRIVLTAYAHPTWNSKHIAQSLELNDRLVRKWRRRWQDTHSLKDLPRSGAPRRFSSEVRAQVTALACSLPRSHGVPLARWSRAELARQVTTAATLPTISARTIGRWLTAEQIRPWRYHSWQHIQKPEAFLLRARPVLQLYEHATSLLEKGIWVDCADEKTSIQARQAEQAPRPALHKHPVYQSPRYKRQGALHLMAADTAWLMDSSMDSATRANASSTSAPLRETVVIAEAQRRRAQAIALVLDNGPTHAPKQLPRWIKELEMTSEGQLTIQLYWLPKNASWLDQLEIWFSLLQRKLLQPTHFCNLDELVQAIQSFITHYNQTAKPLKWSYTAEQLEHKLAPRLI